jgi:hypothetical protein
MREYARRRGEREREREREREERREKKETKKEKRKKSKKRRDPARGKRKRGRDNDSGAFAHPFPFQDLKRSLPEDVMNNEAVESMRRVLIAYSVHNPIVGYCQSKRKRVLAVKNVSADQSLFL